VKDHNCNRSRTAPRQGSFGSIRDLGLTVQIAEFVHEHGELQQAMASLRTARATLTICERHYTLWRSRAMSGLQYRNILRRHANSLHAALEVLSSRLATLTAAVSAFEQIISQGEVAATQLRRLSLHRSAARGNIRKLRLWRYTINYFPHWREELLKRCDKLQRLLDSEEAL